MAGDSYVFRQAAAAAESPSAPLARLYYVAFGAGPTFYQADRRPIGSTQGKAPGAVPWFQAIAPASDLDQLVGDAVALGDHSLKLYTDLPLDRFRAAAAAAHRGAIRAVSHVAVFPIRPRDVIGAGVDGVSHAPLLVGEGVDSLPGRSIPTPAPTSGRWVPRPGSLRTIPGSSPCSRK